MKSILVLSLISAPMFAMQQPTKKQQPIRPINVIVPASTPSIMMPSPHLSLAATAIRIGISIAMTEANRK